MKKTNKFLSLLLVTVILMMTLASCMGAETAAVGIAKIVIENAENDYTVYEVDLAKLEKRDEGAISLLEYIASEEGSTLYYNVQWGGGYGAYITSIGSLNPDPSCEFIALYTTEEADFAIPSEWSPIVATAQYGDITLTYAGVGLSSMNIKDGTVILFRLEGF